MINIISISKEYSTDRVVEWMMHNNLSFNRINTDILENQYQISYDSNKLTSNSKSVKFWKRKISKPRLTEVDPMHLFLTKEINAYWKEISYALSNNLVFGFSSIEEPLNLKMLNNAYQVGLNIPHTLVTCQKKELLNFIDLHDNVILKLLVEPKYCIIEAKEIVFSTSRIIKSDAEKLSDTFVPVFAQQELKKDYEVRIFVLEEKCYAIAFFVKDENKTSSDIREIKKRRETPCNVPQNIQTKIIKFMNLLGSKTGSLDFIVSNNKWYFLEVNPAGQYDFVSKIGNYFLDKKIAKILSK